MEYTDNFYGSSDDDWWDEQINDILRNISTENYIYNMPYSISRMIIEMEICIFLIGLIGNLIACFVIACSKSAYTTTNMYLLNLSISDVLYLITSAPTDIYEFYNDNKFYVNSSTVCFLKNWIGETSVNVSILTITALTVERYLAICHPFFSRAMSQTSRVTRIIIIIWLFAALCACLLAGPSRIIVDSESSVDVMCHVKPLPYTIQVTTILFFALPMTVISILYSMIVKQLMSRKQIFRQVDKHTRKTVKMLVIIIIAFFLCWAPFQVQRLMTVYFVEVDHRFHKISNTIFQYLSIITGVTCVLSATVNPIIYTFMSRNFRNDFKVYFYI